MDVMIHRFAAAARAAGLRIATSEVLDALALLPRVDILDEAQFAALLRANFAKSRLERARFEHLYHLFFHELREDLHASSAPVAPHVEDFRRELISLEPPSEALSAIADFLAADPAAYLELLNSLQSEGRGAAGGPRGAGANLGGLVRRLPVLRALQRAREALDGFLAANRSRIHWETRRDLERHLAGRLETARRLLAGEDPLRRLTPTPLPAVTETYGELGRTPFANLSPGERVRLREAMAQLVRRLRDQTGLRTKARSRGLPDLKRTLRGAVRTQGIPLELRFRRRPPRKGRIVVLCDVSGSVWSTARFMLVMLYALQDCFDRVRSFVFVDAPHEVTRHFDDHEADRALTEVLHDPAVPYGAPTDYGRTLRLFRHRHLDTVTKKTTVIVIGDGRSNYGNPEEAILGEIRDRARRLIWLNPEPEAFWNSGDSEMRSYAVLCNEVRVCQNLNQLADIVRNLVL
jgi:uncharacterized protein with von Willebrand factor type A (vWA) domain